MKPQNMETCSSTLHPNQLVLLPREVRDRIYEYVFLDLRLVVRRGKLNADSFPLALTATCHQLHEEVENHLTTRWNTHLTLKTGYNPSSRAEICSLVPDRFLSRVSHLTTDMESFRCIRRAIETFPGLSHAQVKCSESYFLIPKDDLNTALSAPKRDADQCLSDCLSSALSYKGNRSLFLAIRDRAVQGFTLTLQFFMHWADSVRRWTKHSRSTVHACFTSVHRVQLNVWSVDLPQNLQTNDPAYFPDEEVSTEAMLQADDNRLWRVNRWEEDFRWRLAEHYN